MSSFSGQAGQGTNVSVSSPTVINEEISDADKEYEIALPVNTKRFLLKARNFSKLLVSYDSGMATYWTLVPGMPLEEPNINAVNLSIYVKSAKANEIIEIICWK